MANWILRSLASCLERPIPSHVRDKLELLLESREWDLSRLQELQWNKLQNLLTHAYDSSPFHRARFDQLKLHPKRDFKNLESLSKLPLMTKEDIRKHLEEIKTNDSRVRGIEMNSTGGSTGVPINFYQDENYRSWADAMRIRTWNRIPHIKPGAFEAVLWGAIRDIGKGIHFTKIIKELLRCRTLQLNTFDLDKSLIERFLRYYNYVRPEILRGYASSLVFVAEMIEQHGFKVHTPQVILSSAEVLKPAMRETISRVFGAEIIDSYGCREVSHIANECQAHSGLHIAMENQLIEAVDGSIIVTNLNNLAMPFLRYQVGDLTERITVEPCQCGLKSPRLVKVLGRDNDNINLPNGKTINGEYFEFLFFGLKTVEQFQVVYSRKQQQLRVRLRVTDNSEKPAEMIKQKMKDSFSFENVIVELNEEFEKTSTGKFRFVYEVEEFKKGLN